jgi:D-inositol-3-phosphate glycosyltransferase
VDLAVFTPGDRRGARRRLRLQDDAVVLLFVGRLQPLKAPDLLLRAAAQLVRDDPELRQRLVVAIVGGPSGSGLAAPRYLENLAGELGIADVVRFQPPVPQVSLVDWYRAADVTVVPSYNESFGLVAAESQACGTPVVAAAVGGLTTAVRDGVSGVLVDGHDPGEYARVLRGFVGVPERLREERSLAAQQHARSFGWSAAAARMIDVYVSAMDELREPAGIAVGR